MTLSATRRLLTSTLSPVEYPAIKANELAQYIFSWLTLISCPSIFIAAYFYFTATLDVAINKVV